MKIAKINKKATGYNLYSMRVAAGFDTIRSFSIATGVMEGSISNYENGNKTMGVDALYSMSKVLGCKMEDIVVMEENGVQITGTVKAEIDGRRTGMNIMEMRRDAGFRSIYDFAMEVGATASAVRKWENGTCKPSADALYSMSIVLDCYISDIIVGESE